jgi:hypothetical protein
VQVGKIDYEKLLADKSAGVTQQEIDLPAKVNRAMPGYFDKRYGTTPDR